MLNEDSLQTLFLCTAKKVLRSTHMQAFFITNTDTHICLHYLCKDLPLGTPVKFASPYGDIWSSPRYKKPAQTHMKKHMPLPVKHSN